MLHSIAHLVTSLLLQVAELATQMYITNDKPNVAGLVLSGSADFKTELSQSDMFDPRLQAVVLGVVDVSYGEWAVTHVVSPMRKCYLMVVVGVEAAACGLLLLAGCHV
jgi:peptide subunit release factor 1 (eRF1)